MAGAIITVQTAIKDLHIVEPELHAVFTLIPRHLFLDALGPLAGIGIYVCPKGCVGGVVAGGLSGLHWRRRAGDLDRVCPSRGYIVDVIGILDQMPLVVAQSQVIQQIWSEDV